MRGILGVAASGALFEVSAVTFEAGIALDVAALAVEPNLPNLGLVVVDALTQDPDRLGRVRVRYYWPVAKPAAAESDWLRTLTPYAGDGKGHLFIPEVGSQVLVGHEHGLAEQPYVLGNLFHAQNKQAAKYSTAQNHLKGLQTAGGNKVVMSDTKGAQTILLSNSNNKGTAIQVSFQGDGSITIKSHGPVTVLSPTITLEAGEKGSIKLHAKNITIDADENLTLHSGVKTEMTTATLEANASQTMTLDGTTQATLSGAKVAVAGSATTSVTAPMVTIN